MSRIVLKYTAVAALAVVVTLLFLNPIEEVQAGWQLRDSTAVNPVAVCKDGVYLGVGGQNDVSTVGVTANMVPGGEILFDELFTLPPNPVSELFLTHSGYFYVQWDNAFQPLPVGTEVNFGHDDPFAIPVIATVGDCLINTPGTDVSSTFTYQGSLADGNSPANGAYDFRFWLHDAASGGNQIGSSVTSQNVMVTDGLFTTNIDFGPNAFNGQARWLEIGVRPGNSTGNFTHLSPRQALSAAPYALSLQPGAVISGTLENDAVLHLLNNAGNGLQIDRAYDGVTIDLANNNGIQIGKADNTGLRVDDAREYGIYARTTYTDTTAVVGSATADTGFSVGVRGDTSAAGGTGVIGNNYDFSTGGVGVRGFTSSTDGFGVTGFQSGYSTFDHPSGYFESGGLFGGRNGVIGVTKQDSGYGVYGRDSSSGGGWAGAFISENGDGIFVSTPSGQTGISVSGGSKPAVVATDDGARLLYAEEASEVWFSDYGFGQLVDGVVVITIDPVFAQTVNLAEPYHVFLQAYGDADLYVTNRTADQFEVHLREGDAAVEFSYRLVGKRLGFETDRLERAPWADNDPNLFPDGPVNEAAPAQEQQP
jgi:hypothetical protein